MYVWLHAIRLVLFVSFNAIRGETVAGIREATEGRLKISYPVALGNWSSNSNSSSSSSSSNSDAGEVGSILCAEKKQNRMTTVSELMFLPLTTEALATLATFVFNCTDQTFP